MPKEGIDTLEMRRLSGSAFRANRNLVDAPLAQETHVFYCDGSPTWIQGATSRPEFSRQPKRSTNESPIGKGDNSHIREIRRLQTLEHGWNSYDAPPPNKMACNIAELALDLCYRTGIVPDRIVASADGGVSLVFLRDFGYASFEFMNDGEIVAAHVPRNGKSTVWDVKPFRMQDSIERLYDLMRA